VKRYSLSHLSDESLLRGLNALVAQDRVTTADLLAHVAEVDERKLYLPAGYPSMYLYCVGELRLSEDVAFKRITAARAARRFPAILEAVAHGRLHLAGVGLLAPHLTEHTARDLLAIAEHKTKAEIERLLAERFPRTDMLSWVATLPAAPTAGPAEQLAPGRVDGPEVVASSGADLPQHSPALPAGRPRVTPLSAQSFAIQVTIDKSTHEKLRHAQELLGHQVPSGDIAQVLDRVLDLAIAQLEKRKFAATPKPRRGGKRPSGNPRYIPAHVRRAVWERDGGQCTYVSENGHRCSATEPLEFDHVLEVARGGEASASDIRLRCRAHNQFTAERTFGAEFMRNKRTSAAGVRTAARAAQPRGVHALHDR
jgi:hypothetical protein